MLPAGIQGNRHGFRVSLRFARNDGTRKIRKDKVDQPLVAERSFRSGTNREARREKALDEARAERSARAESDPEIR